MSEFCIYESDKIKLVKFGMQHVSEKYKKWFSDQEVTKYNSHGLFPQTKADLDSFLKSLIGSRTIIMFAIIYKMGEDDKIVGAFSNKTLHVGNCTLQGIDWINRSAEFAIVIGDKSMWGKGIATEALKALMTHGFDKLNLNRIWSGTAATNGGMNNVFTKCGFEKEGEFREAVYLEGEYVNVNEYGLLKKEWDRINEN